MMAPLTEHDMDLLAHLEKALEKRLVTPEMFDELKLLIEERRNKIYLRKLVVQTATLVGALSVIVAAAVSIFNFLGGRQ